MLALLAALTYVEHLPSWVGRQWQAIVAEDAMFANLREGSAVDVVMVLYSLALARAYIGHVTEGSAHPPVPATLVLGGAIAAVMCESGAGIHGLALRAASAMAMDVLEDLHKYDK